MYCRITHSWQSQKERTWTLETGFVKWWTSNRNRRTAKEQAFQASKGKHYAFMVSLNGLYLSLPPIFTNLVQSVVAEFVYNLLQSVCQKTFSWWWFSPRTQVFFPTYILKYVWGFSNLLIRYAKERNSGRNFFVTGH